MEAFISSLRRCRPGCSPWYLIQVHNLTTSECVLRVTIVFMPANEVDLMEYKIIVYDHQIKTSSFTVADMIIAARHKILLTLMSFVSLGGMTL